MMYMRLFVLIALVLSTFGCTLKEPGTFAGFTFGGGGNTFSAEPCQLTFDGESKGELVAGTPEQDVYLKVSWERGNTFGSDLIELNQAVVKVKSKGGESRLKKGHIVLQARDGQIAHGSYDITGSLEDGREVEIVGSFTATIQP